MTIDTESWSNHRYRCRACGRDFLTSVLNLGVQAIVRFKSSPEEKDDYSPLHLVRCEDCQLVQLLHTVPPERLFSQFHYLSGINQSMNEALFDIVKDVEKHIQLEPGDVVVDIGANDGTLLSYYRKYVYTVGFEPARNITEPSRVVDRWINDYFSEKSWFDSLQIGDTVKVKVITAIAMFYDLDDPNKFCRDVYEILADDGIFVIQMNDLDRMIDNLSIDNICHEHLCYYSRSTLQPILERAGLYITKISYNQTNGGSIRVICAKKSPLKIIPPESPDWNDFLSRFNIEKKRLLRYINSEIKKGHSIWGYGASTRGNTLLQLLGLDWTKIFAIADRNPKKWGKCTAGGDIQIMSEEKMREAQPDNLLVLPYYFEREFLEREYEYLKRGGRMLFPLPKFRIITMKDGAFIVHGLSMT